MLQMTNNNDNDNASDDDYDDMLLWCIVAMGIGKDCRKPRDLTKVKPK